MKKEIKIGNKILRITNMGGDQEMNPRNKDFDEGQFGIMICWHTRYNMGDEQMNQDPLEWLAEMMDTDVPTFCTDNGLDFEYTKNLKEKISEAFMDKFYALPIFLYDHSGQTIRTTPFSCNWDSGQVGWIYTTKERIQKVCGEDPKFLEKEWVLKNLTQEVTLYDQWITGDIWQFELIELETCEHCNNIEENQIDSCCGFFGTDWENNGITDHLPDEFKTELLADPNIY